MKATNVALESDAFVDGKEALMDEFDLTEEEAERRRETILTNVMLEAQGAGRNWERDEYMAVVDVLIGIQSQQKKQIEKMETSRIATMARYLPLLFIGTAIIQTVALIWHFTMSQSSGLILAGGILSVCVLVFANVLLK